MNYKRIAIITTLALVPAAAFAATGDVGGLCESLCSLLGCGCP